MWFRWKVKYWDMNAGNFKTTIFEGSLMDFQNIPLNLGIPEEQLYSITKIEEDGI